VADGPGCFSLEQYCVAVAVFPDLVDGDGVARGGAFVPEFLSAAAVEPGFAAVQCPSEGFLVHVGEH